MNALQLASAVAAHPMVTAYREAQQKYRTAMINQYGPDFDNSSRARGIHSWTPAQENVYMSLTRGARIVRESVRKELANNG